MKEEARSELTSYERLLTSLRHREPDRVPFDLGGTMVSGINVNALRRLRLHLGLEGEPESPRSTIESRRWRAPGRTSRAC